jgi:hypothetical protein
LAWASLCVAAWAASAAGQPHFLAPDNRLPSPYQPFVMDGAPVSYGPASDVTIYDLRVQALDPADVDLPDTGIDSQFFDATFPISYHMILGVGLAPPMSLQGEGTMRVQGATILGFTPFLAEVLQMDLVGLSPAPDVQFREAPPIGDPVLDLLRQSRGVITTEPAPGGMQSISAFFDVVTEFSLDGGQNWLQADDALHLVQVPEPATAVMAGATACGMLAVRRRR